MRFGARAALLPGLVLIAAGLALVAQVQADGAYLSGVLPSMLLLGTGVGVSIPALATLAMSGATEGDAGLASGLINTTTQVGAALGLAVLATLSATRSGQLLAQGQPTAEALTGGYRMAFLIAAALVVAAIAVALAVLRPEPAEAGAETEAEAVADPANSATAVVDGCDGAAGRRVTAKTRDEVREGAAGREAAYCRAR
jgi:MFS family permease